MSIAKAINTLYYSKVSGDLSELVDLKEYMAQRIIGDANVCARVCKEDDVAFLQKMTSKGILAGREKKDFTRTAEKGIANVGMNPFLGANIKVNPICTGITLPIAFDGNYFFKGYRTTKVTIPNMQVTPNTVLEVKKQLNVYPNEKFTLAFTKEENGKLIGFSIGVVPATTGMKGQAQCIVTVLTQDAYIIDDASKYMDVSLLVKGMSV